VGWLCTERNLFCACVIRHFVLRVRSKSKGSETVSWHETVVEKKLVAQLNLKFKNVSEFSTVFIIALMMAALQTLVNLYQSARHCNPQDRQPS
jgi:hypothetical protein